MGKKTRHGLSPDDRALWEQVRKTVTPLGPPHARKLPITQPAPRNLATDVKPLSSAPVAAVSRVLPSRGNVTQDLAPSMSARLDAAPLRMDRKEWLRMKRGKIQPDARIDLHGMTLAQAHPALIRFILDAHDKALRTVLVITGKGRAVESDTPIYEKRGVLRHQVPHWLNSGPLRQVVLQVSVAHLRHGGDGAYYVRLRRRG